MGHVTNNDNATVIYTKNPWYHDLLLTQTVRSYNLTILTSLMGVWAVPVPVSAGLVCQVASCKSFGHCKFSVWDSVIQKDAYQARTFLYSCDTSVVQATPALYNW